MNKFILQGSPIDKGAYKEAEAVVIFLCKECVPGLPKLQLPEGVLATVKTFLESRADACGCQELHALTVLEQGRTHSPLIG